MPAIDKQFSDSNSLAARENPVQVPHFCDYKDSKVIGRSVHHMQVSDTLACSDGECEVSQTNEHSFGVETTAELGGEVSRLVGGISASIGVTITNSWTNGKTKTCSAVENESVCIFVAVPYRKIELSNRGGGVRTCSNPETAEGNFPVDKGSDSNFYCVRGKDNCRHDGDGYWVQKK